MSFQSKNQSSSGLNNPGNNLWIGEIENWMDEKYLTKSLESYNISVKKVKIIRDKNSGNILGYGFLEFGSPEAAAAALNALNGKKMPFSDNKTFKLNWASYSQGKSQNNQNEYSIYVCELDPSLNDEMLRDYFSKIYSSVLGAKIIVDPSTKISKGYGFVKFGDYNESQRALVEMNGKSINGKPMKTNQASFKKNAIQDNKKQFKDNHNNHSNLNNQKYDNSSNINNINPNNPSNNNLMYQDQMYNMQNDPNLLLQQQYFYMVNGYYPNQYMNSMYYQMYPYYQQPQPGQDNTTTTTTTNNELNSK